MKKRLLSVALLMGTMAANAQVGIGTATPNKSAELLIESKNRGLLIPNVALTDTKDKTTITNGNVQSLLVYATKKQGDITPGYYYWDVNVWKRLTADADIPGVVINKFGDILKGGDVTNLIKNIVKNTEGNVIYEGDKLYHVTKDGAKVEINFDGVIKAHETLTVLAYNPTTGVLTYTDEKKQPTTIDVKGAVKAFETVTSITTDAVKGTITFIDEKGVSTVLDIKSLVKANETLTVLGYDKAKNTLTYSDEKGAVKVIELGTGAMSYNKDTNTITYVDAKGVPTTLTLNKTSLTYNEGEQKLVYVDSEGKTQTVDLSKLVKANETLTVLGYDKAKNTLTYSDEKGAVKVIELGTGAMSYNKDTNTITYVDAKGVPTTLTLNKTSLTYNEGEQKLVYVDSEGKTQTVDLSKLVKANETLTVLGYDKAKNTLTYSDEKGAVKVIELGTGAMSYNKDTNTITYVNAKGVPTTLTLNKTSLTYNEGEQKLVYVDSEGKTQTVDLSKLVKANETLTVLGYDKAKNTLTYSDEKGAVKVIELGTGAMSYNKDTNTITYVDAKGVPTTLTLNKTSLTYNEGEQKLVYVDSEGKTQTVDLSKLVKANETLTVLGYDKAKNTLTYSDEKGAVKVIELGTGAMSYNKDTNTITYVDAKGVPTTLTLNKTSLTYNEGEQKLVYVDSEGKTQTVDLSKLVKGNETITTLVREKAGKYVYTSENATVTEITVVGDITEVIKNKVDQDLYNVLKQLVNVEQTLTKLVYNATSRNLEYTDEKNATHNINVDALVKENQTLTTLKGGTNIKVTEVNGTNSISYTLDVPTATKDVAGVVKPGSGLDIDAAGNLTVNLDTALNGKDLTGNDIIVVTDGKGAVLKTTALSINEKAIKLENLGGTLNLTQLQAGNAGDVLVVNKDGDVVWSAKDAVTTNSLVLNGTELTSTVNGVPATQTLKDKLTTEMLKDGSVTAEKLGADKKDEGKVPVVQADGTVVYQNISANNVDGKALTSANNLLTVSVESGVVLKDVQLTVNQGKFDLAQIGGTLQLTQIEKGGVDTVLVTEKDGTVKWVTKESVVKANETVTSIVDHGNGTFTYTNEKNVAVKFDGNKTTVDVKEGVYTFKDGNGTTITTIDTNAIASGYNNGTSGLTATNVQAAIDELVSKLKEVANTKGNLTGNGIVVSTSEGVVLKDVVLSIADGAVTTEKIKAGGEDTVLVTEKDGTVKWVTKDSLVKLNETVTQLVFNNNGTFTYYNESEIGADGKPKVGATGVVIDPSLVNVTKEGNSYVFKNAKGDKIATIAFEATDITYNDTTNLGATNVQEAIERLLTKINTVEAHKADLSTDGIILVNDKEVLAGSVLEQAKLSIKAGSITTDKVKAGEEDTVLVTEKDGTVKWVTKDSLVKLNETVTQLVLNDNGTFTYYNESEIGADGKPKAGATGVVIDPSLVNVTKEGNSYVFKNANGGTIATIAFNATDITYNDTTNLGATNVQEAIERLLTKINTVEAHKADLSTDGIILVNDKEVLAGSVLEAATLSIKNGSITSDKIKGGNEGDVLVTDKEGNVKWVTKVDATTNTLAKKDGTNGNTIVSTVNGVPAEIALVDKVENKVNGTTITTVVNGVESTSVDLTSAIEAGQKTTSVEKGSDKVTVVGTTTGKNTEYVVDVNEANLSLQNIGGQVTNNQIQGGKEGDVLVTVKEGGKMITKWVTKAEATTNKLEVVGNELVSTVNGVEGKTDLTQAITTPMLKDGAVTSEKLNAGTGVDNRVAVADAKGNVTYQEVSGKSLNGKALTSGSITVLGGNKALLDATQIDVTGGKNKGDVLVTTDKPLKDAANNDVVVDGKTVFVTEWVPANELGNTVTAGNGLTKTTDGKIELGGALDKDTVIKVQSGKELAIEGLHNLGDKVDSTSDKLVVADANGVLKQTSTKDIIADAIAKGNDGTPENELKAKGITGTGITVTGGTNATLKDVTLAITPGTAGQVMVTGDDNKTTWVNQNDIVKNNTSNELTSKGNTMTSNVNGVSKTADIVNSVGNSLNDKNELITAVNGVSSTTGIDLTPAIQAGQKTTVVAQGTGVTVTPKTEGKVTTYTVSADTSNITLGGDVTGNADNTTISKLQGKDLVTTNVAKGNVLVFDGDKWVNKTPSVDASNVENGETLSTDGIILVDTDKTSSEGSLLKAAKLSIKEGGITSKEIKNGTIVPEDIANTDNPNQVLVTGSDNQPKWIDQSTLAIEPWNVQGGIVKATTNVQDIYQQGKVAIGFTKDDVTTKTLDVKGDFRTVAKNGDVYSGFETNLFDKDVKTTTNLLYSSKSPINSLSDFVSSNEIGGIYTSNNGVATIAKNNGNTVALSLGAVGSTHFDISLAGGYLDENKDQYSANLWGTSEQWVLSHTKQGKSVQVSVEGDKGVTFKHEQEGYTFPMTKGNMNQILVTDGAISDSGKKISKLEWKNALDILTPGNNNQVLTTVDNAGTKTVEWKTPVVDITKKGNLTSTTEELLTVKDGNGAVLQNVSLTVNQDKFDLNKIGGNLNVTQIQKGGDNQVLVTEGDKVTWVDNKTFVQANQEKVVVKPADGKTTGTNSNVIVTPTTGKNGEKEYTVDVKAAMPKVFYMPPVMFDTSKKHNVLQTRNLYDEYVAMFGGTGAVVDTPIEGTRPPMVQSDASATIPVYKKEDLNFFVPYYDPAVFSDVEVDANGVLTYKVIKKAKYGAFMTVVFVVK